MGAQRELPLGRAAAMRAGGLIVVVPAAFRRATLSAIEASAGHMKSSSKDKEVALERNA